MSSEHRTELRTDYLPAPELRGEPTVQEERVARRVAELLRGDDRPDVRYLDTARVAEMLCVEPSYVRDHWRELGGFRLPSKGGQGRLRFDPQEVKRRLSADTKAPERPRPQGSQRPRRLRDASAPLIPIRGEK
jgi:hypothetical protein